MKTLAIITAFLINSAAVVAQQETINNLKRELTITQSETGKIAMLDSLGIYYLYFTKKPDSSFLYFNEEISNALPLQDKGHLILAYARMGLYFFSISDYKGCLEISLKGIQLSRRYNIPYYLSALYNNIAFLNPAFENFDTELKYACEGELFLKDYRDPYFNQAVNIYSLIGDAYAEKKVFDSAFYYLTKARNIALHVKNEIADDLSLWYMGEYYLYVKNHAKADSIFSLGIQQCLRNNDYQWIEVYYWYLAESLAEQNKFAKAIPFAHSALSDAQLINEKGEVVSVAKLLYSCYQHLGFRDSAFYYLKISDSLNTKVISTYIDNQISDVAFSQQLRETEDQADRILQNQKVKNRLEAYFFFTATGFLVIILLILLRNNRQRRKTNNLLQRQKEEIQSTLTELKSTQAQLIQSEKMASLGELTAGIAHEIQNPLNFVNNFSEVNNELLAEMKEEMEKGNMNDAKSIASDAIENGEKILHHGRRADAIVKNMLQHSKQSKGVKEPTDINALCDEYLRLSYHGLRAKDKSFNAELKTDFDPTIGKINIIPQDIGRVLLNLFNNAFYAVNARLNESFGQEQKSRNLNSYNPTVSVTTRKCENRVIITVSDNGNGIPQKIVDKIFQPFFTTKPTGEGTGLGLSLSYDIIKAHGGEIKVETKEGEGSEFIIQLPA